MTAARDQKALEATRRQTTALQTEAADPITSAWVSANAGTGKTHVLTNRVLRLLLAGTAPERILCLTFTKAAAAEMSARVFDKLARWVTMDDGALAKELAELQQRPPAEAEIVRARDLFTLAIETPGGLKVQTIHAFCERLLQRFPLEAGISPQFAILDEQESGALQRDAMLGVLEAATSDAESELGRALDFIVTYAADEGFDQLLREALGRRDWLEAAGRIDPGHNDRFAGAEQIYRDRLGIAPDATRASLDRDMAGLLSDGDMDAVASALASSTMKSDVKSAEAWTAARKTTSETQRIAALAKVLLTGEGGPRERLLTSGLKAKFPHIDAILLRAQQRFLDLMRARDGLQVMQGTLSLLRLADAVHQRYAAAKHRRAALDFDDLIRVTRHLLTGASTAEWVLFKLDGGLDHILVDEAQDTSPDQWKIVEGLAAEFFAGEGRERPESAQVRTLFAVGDEKQSIYGFQGAAPEMFSGMGQRLAALAANAGRSWASVPLTLSFRTVAPVLELVDAVFAGAAGRGVTASGIVERHVANRLGSAGVVEIWDPEQPEEVETQSVWKLFSDRVAKAPAARLADRIAETIAGWLRDGERLASEDRPVRAGDIVVLVRKRRPFAPLMVAALKARGIAVAGADRLQLTEQLAVRDVLVLADFLLLPEDDLALATVLKSPLFGLDDDDLMEIAPRRRGTLWSTLLGAARNIPKLAEAADTLKRWRGRADVMPPFEFLIEVLDRDRMRERLIERIGPEASDALDELVNLALHFDDGEPPSLQGFVDWLRRSERQIKRDMEHGRNEVRVMTVHGAKGLEAPIVFLPDTCSTASGNRAGGLLRIDPPELVGDWPKPFLWPLKGSRHVGAVKGAREQARDEEARERNRLLYVALTRPRDRLYVAGYEGKKKRAADCWYDLIEAAIDPARIVETKTAAGRIRRIATAQAGAIEKPRHGLDAQSADAPRPAWAEAMAPREPGLTMPLAPSRLAPLDSDQEGEPVEPPRDPLLEPPFPPRVRSSGEPRFLRGTLTHALLQHLPGQPEAARGKAAKAFVDQRGKLLKAATRRSIVAETMAVLDDQTFGVLFGPDSRAEVPIVADVPIPGSPGQSVRVNGQIDRLVRLANEVVIVDYKTNRPPPSDIADVAETYLLQLAAYRLAVSRVFSGLPVRAALLWTEVPRLMAVPTEILDQAEARLFALKPSG